MTQQISAARIRVGGGVIVLGGLVLAWVGAVLAGVVSDMRGILPRGPVPIWDQMTDPAGLAVLWIFLFAGISLIMGADMLIFARRNRWLFRVVLGLAVIVVVTGVVTTLQDGARMPWVRF